MSKCKIQPYHKQLLYSNQKLHFVCIVLKTDRFNKLEFPGVIDFLISNHPIAKILREHLVFKIVPCLNPDGVYLGNYRLDHLNRFLDNCLRYINVTHSITSS